MSGTDAKAFSQAATSKMRNFQSGDLPSLSYPQRSAPQEPASRQRA